MAKTSFEISDELSLWVAQQKLFFVSTAPLAASGSVNCSPKGGDTFRVLDPVTVCYLDLTGSGVETISHLQENGRIVIMFCAFEGKPLIVRFHGEGRVVYPGSAEYDSLKAQFVDYFGARAIIVIRVKRVTASCGMAVPHFAYERDRTELEDSAKRKGATGLEAYRREKNARSVDGLPGYPI